MTKAKLRSMTGFGRGVAKVGDVRVTVELRSVNQRFLRVGVRMQPHFASLEPRVRELLGKGEIPPKELTRPEIAEILIEFYASQKED